MEARIFKFHADIPGDMVSYETYPVYEAETNKLVGGFTLCRGSVIVGFISGVGYGLALEVSTNGEFYFTAFPGKSGRVSYGKITAKAINDDSKKVSCASEETISVE